MSVDEDLIQRIQRLSHPLQPNPTSMGKKLFSPRSTAAVIFDIYGTLFISASGDIGASRDTHSGRAMSEALESTGIRARPETGLQGRPLMLDFIRKGHIRARKSGVIYPEVNIIEIWNSVLLELKKQDLVGDEWSMEQLRILAVEYECRVNPVWPMPGMMKMLSRLTEMQIPVGIVSNAQFYTPLIFPALSGMSMSELGFHDSLCAWSYRSRIAKPSLSLFLPVADELKRRFDQGSGEIIYVGNDMLNDILPAQRLGWQPVLFAGDQRSLRLRSDDSRCADLAANTIITSLDQVLELIR